MAEYLDIKKTGTPNNELRIRGVSLTMKEQIKNVADHLGVTQNDMVKSGLRKILDLYPPHYLKPLEQ